MRKTGHYLFAVAILLCALAVPEGALSQQHPNLERGLGAESNQSDTLDSVNIYNGNLSLVIPIGGGRNAGGSFTYRLTLVYNSNVWDFKEAPDGSITGGGGIALKAVPDPKTNAGLGWHLSLGALYRPNIPDNESGSLTYVAPDGSEHYFYQSLHQGEASDGRMYTRDGSYLRYAPQDCVVGQPTCNSARGTVEFPDGQIHTFDSVGHITQMADRFGNTVIITYPGDKIVLTDSFQRVVNILYTQEGQVDKVQLPAFGTTTPAEYDFSYRILNIARHEKNTYNWVANGQAERVDVRVLDTITLPAGAGSYAFTYESDYGTGGVPGVIRSATVPALGRYEWDFTKYRFPVNDPTEPLPAQEPSFQQRISSSDGVLVKRIYDAGATTPAGQWVYTQRVESAGTEWDPHSGTMTVVRTPAGDETIHHFNTTFNSWDSGLPYTLKATNSDGSLFVSKEIYKGLASGGDRRRIVYVRYEADGGLLPGTSGDPKSNPRQSVERTLFLDDSSKYHTISNSDFDGLGHYRQTVVSGNFIQNGTSRTISTRYNPGGKPSTAAPWILGTYDEVSETESGVTAKRGYCFDAATGFLNQVRTMAGASPSANDLVVQYSRSANSRGAVSREQYFGGDQGGAGTAPCATLSGAQYRIDYTYSAGSVQTKAYKDAGGATTLVLLDRDIDAGTGLPSAERDAAGIEDTFEYDAIGRLRWVKPAPTQNNRAWVEIEYTAASAPANLAKKAVRQRNQNDQTVHTETVTTFDGFGRPARQEELMANNVRGAVETRYNAMGWKTAVSQKMSGTPTEWTLYQNFDPFGRPQRIVPADGSAHAIDIAYGGVRGVTRTTRLGLSLSGSTVTEGAVNSSEVRDQHGRLVRAIENSADPANMITADYEYDVGNRLRKVTVTSRGGATQTRTFNYDSRGLLQMEVNPEEGTTLYSDYNARGRARVRSFLVKGQTSTAFDLRTTYDRAERVTLVAEASGSQRPLKQFAYGAGATDLDRSAGKVVTATRHNYQDDFGRDLIVTENYRYAGVGGNVSQRDTIVDTGDGSPKLFTQGWDYTNLGQVATTSYPLCQSGECTRSMGTPSFAISYAYSRGYLSIVGGFVNQTTYHPNGIVSQMNYSNGVTWTQANDLDSIARPSRISTSGVVATANGGNFDSGAYMYDGAGNITGIGQNRYAYDPYNRLTVAVQLNQSRWQQNYSYDDFGNLTRTDTTDPFGVATSFVNSVSQITNKLSNAGYDEAGNQTTNGNNQYKYDPFNLIKRFTEVVGGAERQDWFYAYTATDQRIWSYNRITNQSAWKLRDADGKVLREYNTAAQPDGTVGWSMGANYVYHGARLVGSADPANSANNRFYITDHLGTPRLIVNQAKQAIEAHAYLPYGLERPQMSTFSTGTLQFTGHERDLNNAGESDDLDYMHARYYNMRAGRFLSPDPGDDNDPARPLSWNKYAYVRNNPVNKLDPDGKFGDTASYVMQANTDGQPTNQPNNPQPPANMPMPLWCDWKIIQAMNRAWQSAQTGVSGIEAGFRVDNLHAISPNFDLPYGIKDFPTQNENKRLKMSTIEVTTDIMHVHPNGSGPKPSLPDRQIVDKIYKRDGREVGMYTFGRQGLWYYSPVTKKDSILLRPGLEWQNPCP